MCIMTSLNTVCEMALKTILEMHKELTEVRKKVTQLEEEKYLLKIQIDELQKTTLDFLSEKRNTALLKQRECWNNMKTKKAEECDCACADGIDTVD